MRGTPRARVLSVAVTQRDVDFLPREIHAPRRRVEPDVDVRMAREEPFEPRLNHFAATDGVTLTTSGRVRAARARGEPGADEVEALANLGSIACAVSVRKIARLVRVKSFTPR